MGESLGSLVDSGAGFFPTNLSGLVGWYDFADPATLFTDTGRTTPVASDGDAIKGLTDKSGAGHHMSQAAGPTYKVNIINGHSIARFDGVANFLAGIGFATHAQPFTVMGVIDNTAPFSLKLFATLNNTTNIEAPSSANGIHLYADSFTADWFGGTSDPAILVGIYDGASSKLYRDGGAGQVDNPGTQARGADWSIGGYAGGTNLGQGDIGEVLVYDGRLSVANINLLGNYLGTRWGITWTTAT